MSLSLRSRTLSQPNHTPPYECSSPPPPSAFGLAESSPGTPPVQVKSHSRRRSSGILQSLALHSVVRQQSPQRPVSPQNAMLASVSVGALPDGWEIREDAVRGIFYANPSQGLLQLSRPRGPEGDEQQDDELPAGWVQRVDWAVGKPYYYCPATGTLQWERPVSETLVLSRLVDSYAAGQPNSETAFDGVLCSLPAAGPVAGLAVQCSPASVLLSLLLQKFAEPSCPSQGRLRICKGVMRWVQNYPEDFLLSPDLLRAAEAFAAAVRMQKFELTANGLETRLADIREGKTRRSSRSSSSVGDETEAEQPVLDKWFTPAVLPVGLFIAPVRARLTQNSLNKDRSYVLG